MHHLETINWEGRYMILHTREGDAVEVIDIDYSQAPFNIKIVECNPLNTETKLSEEDIYDLEEFNYELLIREWLDGNSL